MTTAAHATEPAVPITEAAERLGVHPATVRRWIAEGAPTVELGSVGRGHGSRVNVEALRRFRARRGAEEPQPTGVPLEKLAALLLDFYRRDSGTGYGEPATARSAFATKKPPRSTRACTESRPASAYVRRR